MPLLQARLLELHMPPQQGSPRSPHNLQTPLMHTALLGKHVLPAQHGWSGRPHAGSGWHLPRSQVKPTLQRLPAQHGCSKSPQVASDLQKPLVASQVSPVLHWLPAQQS